MNDPAAPRKILHLDLDAFFCAVEEQRDPSLRGRAFAVGGRPEHRGVVASCSYPARRFGVHSAMPMARAVQLCPYLIIVPSRHGVYSRVSRKVMEHLYELTALVEKVSIDEAFLDVSALADSQHTIAHQLQEKIYQSTKMPCSIGGATNKLVAKIANDVGKSAHRGSGPPNALTIVPPGEEAAFLAPLPVEALWGVGPKTGERLNELGIRTIGDLARWPAADLERRFGKHGQDLALRARGIDTRSIETEHETKSISQETTFARDIRDGRILRETLREQAEKVAERLREQELAGSTVKIKLRWPDFTTITRQVTLEQPTNQADDIYQAVLSLMSENWQEGRAVRLIGVGVSNLGVPVRQLSLWDAPTERQERLQKAVKELRARFGEDVIKIRRKR